METKVQAWGNSLGVRIPRGVAQDAGVHHGTVVDITLDGNRIVVRPARRRGYRLEELLRGVKASNLHCEVDMGAPVGRESW